jgi:protein involved in polysaccharide export with SLBB domain
MALMFSRRPLTYALGLAAALMVSFGTAAAQSPGWADGSGLNATRTSLEQMLNSGVDGQQTAVIQTRLQEGDFRAGDRIRLIVEGHPDLSETYTVEPGPVLRLPMLDPIPLNGVLRSELESHLVQQLGRYMIEPRVRAESTIRVVVEGGVGSPGFYDIASTALLTDVLEQAGGTGGESQLRKIRIERNGSRIISGDAMYQSIIAGRSIDQMNLRAGDRVIVPSRTNWNTVRNVLGVALGVASIARWIF